MSFKEEEREEEDLGIRTEKGAVSVGAGRLLFCRSRRKKRSAPSGISRGNGIYIVKQTAWR